MRPILSLIVVAAVCAGSRGQPLKHDDVRDPTIGISIWSVHARPRGVPAWQREIDSIAGMGFGGVTILPQFFVDLRTGQVTLNDPTPNPKFGGMTDWELSAAIRRGKSLGLVVTVSPTLEAANRAVFRGHIAFNDPRPDVPDSRANPDNGEDSPAAEQLFWASYTRHIAHLARISQEAGADRFNIGAELAALDSDPRNARHWAQLIDAADQQFRGELGYTSVHWNVDHPAAIADIWANPKIDYISCSAYFDLATREQAARSGEPGDKAFVAIVRESFAQALETRVLPTARKLKKKVVLNEIGVTPYDGATVNPWDWTHGDRAAYDPAEARNAFEGIFRALAGRRDEIAAANLWVWGWEGGFPGERFYIRDPIVDLPHTPFDETQMRLSVEWIKQYLRQ